MAENEKVVVEGEPLDPEASGAGTYPIRTPRDAAIKATKAGEDVGLEASVPDYSEPVTLPAKAARAETFVDKDGQEWTRGTLHEQKAPVIDPEAVRKQGGDPGTLGIPPNRQGERYVVPGASNESYSPDGVVDREDGSVREKTVEEGGIAPQSRPEAALAPNAVKNPSGKARAEAGVAKAKAAGRGGSSAKSRAGGKARGGAKRKK